MNTDNFYQYPLKIQLKIFSSWVGVFEYKLTIDRLSSINFSHQNIEKSLRQLNNDEVNKLIQLIQKINLPFTKKNDSLYGEPLVCDGSAFELSIKSKRYKVSFSYMDGQDEISNKSIIIVSNYIESLVDTKDLMSSFGQLD